jgi:hypothetical protein
MNKSMLQRILIRRYGQPKTCIERGLIQECWNAETPDDSSILYIGMKWNSLAGLRFATLNGIYGNAFGGFLIGDCLKLAVLTPRKIYGLWNMDELRMLPAVQYATTLDPAIDFFMDAANVWYYGIKKGELWVFDAETDELDSLGPIEPALETLLDEWEEVREEP